MNQHPTIHGRRTPSFPSPVSPDHDADPGTGELIHCYGYCAPWCRMDGPTSGQTVADHGHLCEGPAVAVDAWGAHEDERTVWASVVQHYRAGLYRREDVVGRPALPLVQLVWEDAGSMTGDVFGAVITPSSARSLAAALVRLADVAEGLDLPARRRGGETR